LSLKQVNVRRIECKWVKIKSQSSRFNHIEEIAMQVLEVCHSPVIKTVNIMGLARRLLL